VVIDGFQVALAFKYNINSVFGLHDTPMILQAKLFDYRTIAFGKKIQAAMDQFAIKALGNSLGLGKIIDGNKQIVN
jgi:hypothetical protein